MNEDRMNEESKRQPPDKQKAEERTRLWMSGPCIMPGQWPGAIRQEQS